MRKGNGDCSTGLHVQASVLVCRRKQALRGCAQITGLEEALGSKLPGDLETEDARAALDRLVRATLVFMQPR